MLLSPLLLCAFAAELTAVHVDVIGNVRDAWRRPVHIDAVESAMCNDTLDALAWLPITPDDGGGFDIPDDGWARVRFDSETAGPSLLRVAAVGDVWINGLPRGGDIYGNGLELPFMVRQGSNDVLLRKGRGRPAPAVLTGDDLGGDQARDARIVRMGTHDSTLPDAISDSPLDAFAGIDVASVAVIAGTGRAGRHLTATLPLFLAGVGWPDWAVLHAQTLCGGERAIYGAGFFGPDWSLDPTQSSWLTTIPD